MKYHPMGRDIDIDEDNVRHPGRAVPRIRRIHTIRWQPKDNPERGLLHGDVNISGVCSHHQTSPGQPNQPEYTSRKGTVCEKKVSLKGGCKTHFRRCRTRGISTCIICTNFELIIHEIL